MTSSLQQSPPTVANLSVWSHILFLWNMVDNDKHSIFRLLWLRCLTSRSLLYLNIMGKKGEMHWNSEIKLRHQHKETDVVVSINLIERVLCISTCRSGTCNSSISRWTCMQSWWCAMEMWTLYDFTMSTCSPPCGKCSVAIDRQLTLKEFDACHNCFPIVQMMYSSDSIIWYNPSCQEKNVKILCEITFKNSHVCVSECAALDYDTSFHLKHAMKGIDGECKMPPRVLLDSPPLIVCTRTTVFSSFWCQLTRSLSTKYENHYLPFLH